MSAGERLGTLHDQLTGLEYEPMALELIRFRPDPTDDAVAGVVRSVTAEGESACQEFRDRLSEAEAATLRLFSTRRVLHARRTSSVAAVYESLDSFALLPRLDDVPWDTWVRADLVVARSIGGDPGSIQSRFDDVAGERAAHRFGVVLDAMDRVEGLSECRIAEVRTTYGTGFVETLIFRGRTTIGALSAPRQADHEVTYAPTSNLAQLAAGLADAVDASGHALSGPIGQDQLAASMFSLTVPGSYVATTGCLSFIVDGVESGPTVSVFCAELPDDADADDLARAARTTDDQAAVLEGRRLILLSPQPSFDDEDAGATDLGELTALAQRALADPATR